MRKVVISSESQVPPVCCPYSNTGSGITCLQGISILREKHGSTNFHTLLYKRHFTSTWKDQYRNLTFPLPSHNDVDAVMILAMKEVMAGETLNVPKSILPPRGRQITETGKRLKAWIERGPAAPKRRCYIFSLFHLGGYTRENCPIRQMFNV